MAGYGDLFNVLAFPCNQFAEQEPEETEVIVKQMTEAYGVEFPMFKKIDVVGEHASPLYRELVGQYCLYIVFLMDNQVSCIH